MSACTYVGSRSNWPPINELRESIVAKNGKNLGVRHVILI
jgi:hypothetical protein